MAMALNTSLATQTLQDNAVLSAQPKAGKKIDDAAKQFEAMFLTQMLSHMTSGLEVDETFGGGSGEEMFRSMLNEQYAKGMTQTGTVGITSAVKAELLKLQEGAH